MKITYMTIVFLLVGVLSDTCFAQPYYIQPNLISLTLTPVGSYSTVNTGFNIAFLRVLCISTPAKTPLLFSEIKTKWSARYGIR